MAASPVIQCIKYWRCDGGGPFAHSCYAERAVTVVPLPCAGQVIWPRREAPGYRCE